MLQRLPLSRLRDHCLIDGDCVSGTAMTTSQTGYCAEGHCQPTVKCSGASCAAGLECMRETHGVEGLRVGGARVSAHVVEHMGQLTARLTTSAPLRLHLSGAHGDEWLDVRQSLQVSLA